MPVVPLSGAGTPAEIAVVDKGNVGWHVTVCPFWLVNGVHASSVLFWLLITVMVSLPRFNTNSRLLSELITAYTGQEPSGIFDETVLFETSMPSASPGGAVVGFWLHCAPSVTFPPPEFPCAIT